VAFPPLADDVNRALYTPFSACVYRSFSAAVGLGVRRAALHGGGEHRQRSEGGARALKSNVVVKINIVREFYVLGAVENSREISTFPTVVRMGSSEICIAVDVEEVT